MINKIFLLKTEEKNWLKIIIWWELRRILYNFFLVVFGVLSLTILSFIIKDIWSFFSPPIFLFMWIAIFLILANVFYTSGWIYQLLSRKSSNYVINKLKPKIFIYGLFISAFVTFLPCFITGIQTIISGERIKSAYADFTTEKPNIKDIVGEYKLSEKTKKELNISEIDAQKIKIEFNADGTFEFKNFPENKFGGNLTDFENINAKGKWKIELDQGSWILPMDFKSITNCKTGKEEGGTFDYGSFNLNGNKPPYEIYKMVGDPDSWEGITMVKK